MNIKTTLTLVVLVGAGVLLWWFGGPELPPALRPAPAVSAAEDKGTREFLESLQPDKIERIEVQAPRGTTILTHEPKDGWSLPGNWHPRAFEVNALVHLLADLRSRFQPQPLTDKELAALGLDQPAVVVRLTVDGEVHRLSFGEQAAGSNENRFSRDTYVRLDKKPEAVRLAPGLIARLDKPTEYYQERRVFLKETVTLKDGRDTVEQLKAQSVRVEDDTDKKKTQFTLIRPNEYWKDAELSEPVRDRLDEPPTKSLLTAVRDVWVEKFAPRDCSDAPSIAGSIAALPLANPVTAATQLFFATPKGLEVSSGLARPQRTIEVKQRKDDTNPVTLHIGSVSARRTRMVPAPRMPNMPPGMQQPRMMPVTEEFRYAKLERNEQIFEIKADKLKDVFVSLDTLRDNRIARFKSADARRIEIQHGGEDLVLEKDKENWKLVKPQAAEADNTKVNDLLTKLSELQPRDKDAPDKEDLKKIGKDVLDKEDPKKYGFDKPEAVVKITVEEEEKGKDGGDSKADKKKKRTLTVRIGKHDAEQKKLYVMADDWPRINVVDDSLQPLVTRSAVAYRGKRLLDFNPTDVAKLEVENQGKAFALEQDRGWWRLTQPVKADADVLKVEQLIGDLGHLEAVDYVNSAPKKDELEKEYGLGKAALTVRVEFVDKKKKPQVLHVGKARGKDGYFAQLGDGPVFTLSPELHRQLAQDSLRYRPQTLWQLLPDEIVSLRIHKAGEKEYSLTRGGSGWKISGPFEASAFADTVGKMTAELGSPKIDSYKVHEAKDLGEYGLDKPALTVTLKTKEGKQYELLIGKPAGGESTDEKAGGERYAKRGDDAAIFTIGEPIVAVVDRGAIDLLNRTLLAVDHVKLERVQVQAADNAMTLEKKDDAWQVTQSPAGAFPADARAADRQEALWVNLQADHFAAYGSTIDWAKYGLDKPAVRITLKVGKDEHTVELGKSVESEPGARYVRVDKGMGLAVLPLTTTRVLSRTYLDYVNRQLLKFDGQAVTALQRHAGAKVLEIVKKDDAWHIVKPVEQKADDPAMQQVCEQLGNLHAARIAAYPIKDLKPFGLDTPLALVTIKLQGKDKLAEHVIKLGKTTGPRGERFALVDDGKAVAVLPSSLSEQLAGSALSFRDRALAHFTAADRLRLQRGPRDAVFSKSDGAWRLTEPLKSDAEQEPLDEFVKDLSHLRADALVAEKPDAEQLKKYGLDRPEAQWRVQAGDKDVLTLLVGNKETNGVRRYAKLAKSDVVCLLDPRLSQKVLDEYRPRTVWSPPLDALQIESLNYRYRRNPFLLEKAGAGWQAVGKADAKINAATVEDTLVVLAGLKLSRYVVDKGANLALFGLDKPELILEVATRSGKRVLQIGNVEGSSKGRYARVTDADRTDVFVLDEETCARLVRDLPAFGRPPARSPAQPAR